MNEVCIDIVGGKRSQEAEYTVVDGVITYTGKSVAFAGGFGGTVLKGGEGSLTLRLTCL